MFDNFEKYINGVLSLYGGSYEKMVLSLTDKLIMLKNTPNSSEIAKININKMVPSRFYFIQYNYNGNKIWCPILALEYRVIDNKNIMYAINLEYLPPKYKIKLFNIIFKTSKSYLDKIIQVDNVVDERPLPFNFQNIYNLLKSNGNMNFSITAFDMLKIKELYLVSIKISPEILLCNLKRTNSKNMKDLFVNTDDIKMKAKLGEIIEEYDDLIEKYEENSITYHKELSQFETKFKLFENFK